MKIRTMITSFAAAGAIMAAPAFAQQSQPGEQAQGSDQQLTQEQGDQQGANLTVSPTVVRQVQEALNNAGYDVGNVDGQWGQNTQSAMEQFQQAQGLEPTGQINQRSLQALGVQIQGGQQQALGSQQQQQQPLGEQAASGDQPLAQEETAGAEADQQEGMFGEQQAETQQEQDTLGGEQQAQMGQEEGSYGSQEQQARMEEEESWTE